MNPKIHLVALTVLLSVILTGCTRRIADIRNPAIGQLWATSSRNAWIVDASGRVQRTVDGGSSWFTSGTSPKASMSNMFFLSETLGWAIDQSNRVLETFDAGRTWQGLCVLSGNGFIAPCDILFADRTHGWIVTRFSVWRTVDGGRSWEQHSVETYPAEHQITASQFLDPDNGWLVTEGGWVYRTANGGVTWERRRDGSNKSEPSVNGIFFINEKVGWAGDALGVGVYHTSDGGRTWMAQVNPSRLHFIDKIYFFNERDGLLLGKVPGRDALGFTLDSVFDDVIMRTTDGGQTWTTQRPALNPIPGEPAVDLDAGALVTLVIPNDENPISIDSWQGWAASDSDVYRTEDGGRSWRHVLHVDLPAASAVPK